MMKDEQKRGQVNATRAIYPVIEHDEKLDLWKIQCTVLMDYANLGRAQILIKKATWQIVDWQGGEPIVRSMSRVTENIDPRRGLHCLQLTDDQMQYIIANSREAIAPDLEILAFYHYANKQHFTRAVKPEGFKVTMQELSAGRVNYETRFHFKHPTT
jgi:hypothetical protein